MTLDVAMGGPTTVRFAGGGQGRCGFTDIDHFPKVPCLCKGPATNTLKMCTAGLRAFWVNWPDELEP